MNIFNNLKIGTKIMLGFFVVTIIAIAIGVMGILNLNLVADKDIQMYQKMTVPMGNNINMLESFQKMGINLREVIMATTTEEIMDHESKLQDNKMIFDENFNEFEKTLLSDAGKEAARNVKDSEVQYEKVANQIIALKKENKDAEAIVLLNGDGTKISEMVEGDLQKLTGLKISLAKEASDSNAVTVTNSRNLMISFILVGVIIAIGLGIVIARTITKPIKKLVDYADRLALGDTDIQINNERKDEIGALMEAFNKMLGNITKYYCA
jgi:methyl-accepting chemotaxis protein